MSAIAPTISNEMVSVITEQGAPQTVNVDAPATQETNFVTPSQFKQMQKERAHQVRLMKKRQERWAQPFADAKIEDIEFVLQKMNELGNRFNQILYQIEVTRKALYKAGVIAEADIQAVLDYDNKRVEKANELRDNTTLSVEEKKAIAAEYEIPLAAIGLSETPQEGDAERNISEPSQSS